MTAMALAVFGCAVLAQEKTLGLAAFSESEALNMAQEWAALVSEANVAGLEKLLNDNYTHIHGTALVESKSQFLEALRNGSRKYDPIKIEDTKVLIYGTSAIVTGKFNLKVLARGKTIEGVNRFGMVLVKTPNGSQVVYFQATPIPQQR
jgi:hypothetical protein